MYMQSALALVLAAAAEARFGQEQGNGAITAIGALTDLGQSGQAATLAGGSIQFLLAAANPCDKLKQADTIVAQLGTSDRAIAAARGLVAAEQNFNPFVVSIPNICNDPSLPATAELRGVVPLIDPAVTGQDVENANSKKSITTPFSATGLSVAQVMAANGFSNFTAIAADGTKSAGSSLGGGAAAAASGNTGNTGNAGSASSSNSSAGDAAAANPAAACNAAPPTPTTFATVATAAPTAAASAAANNNNGAAAAAAGSGAVTDAVTGNFPGFVKSSIANLDFGKCVPTIKFEESLNGRKPGEFTFQAIDPLVNKGQQEALNPNIITNRIKDQLTNVCGANQAAKDAAVAAQAKISALGTRDKSTADAWNTELGFAGTDTNPDQAPKAGLVGHT